MRLLFSAVVSTGLLAGHAADAQSCARPTEKAAFAVAGLKSQLMVTAITCQAQSQYNAFVVRFRSELTRNDGEVRSYFRRIAGRRAQSEHDDYITALANAQSENGIQSGTLFCAETISLFDAAMQARSGAELSAIATAIGAVQPIALIDCAGPQPVARTRTIAALTQGDPRRR